MSLLTDRASILRAYFRLVNADSTDEDMIEHDDSTLEGAYEALAVGQERAQLYLIRVGRGDRWLTTSSALTFSGADPDKRAALPSDFLRLDSDPDQRRSGLRRSTGLSWGREIGIDDRNRVTGGSHYYLREDSDGLTYIYLVRSAVAASNLVADYYKQATTLADSTDADMPAPYRPLIPALAAEYAMMQSWFAGDMEQKQAITASVAATKRYAFSRSRLTRRARQVQSSRHIGRIIT